ncbi:hypothetical protein COCNU_contig69310009G000010 [Cocos nucifera]|nr:hypothetical protein [Cocos nucifera]
MISLHSSCYQQDIIILYSFCPRLMKNSYNLDICLQGSHQKHGSEHGSGDEEAQKGSTAQTTSNEVTQTPSTPIVLNPTVPFLTIPPGGLVGPTTTLNIGMDYRGGSASISAVRGKVPSGPSMAPFVPSRLAGSRDCVPTDPSIQDERELKRQKRKQSNRESARRSRLRKQVECEELASRVVTLKEENNSLKEELKRMRGECDKLTSENATLAVSFNLYFSPVPSLFRTSVFHIPSFWILFHGFVPLF